MRLFFISVMVAVAIAVAVVWLWTQRSIPPVALLENDLATASDEHFRALSDRTVDVVAYRIEPDRLKMGVNADGIRTWSRGDLRVTDGDALVIEKQLAYQRTPALPVHLTPAQRDRLKRLVAEDYSHPLTKSLCLFSPGIVYRCSDGSGRVCDVVVCFHCQEWAMVDGSVLEPVTFAPVAKELLALSRELFPDDEALRAVTLP
jgi:hypothetical protein